MKYFGNINYIKSIEYWLNITQWLLMEIFLKLSTWATSIILDWEVFYSLANSKIIDELPLLFKTKNNIIKNINVLVDKELIVRRIEKNKSYYKITEKWKEFEGVEKNQYKCVKKSTPGVEKNQHYNNTIYNNINIIKDIIEILNKTTGKNYKHNNEKTKKLITARLNDWFNIDDFKKVIDIKSNQWLKDDKMKIYLRPETLFWTKFEWYLNEYPNNIIKDNFNINDLVF